MRVYAPATPAHIGALADHGSCEVEVVFVADANVYEDYELQQGDDEIAEFIAMDAAADLAAEFGEQGGTRKVIVIAADVESEQLAPTAGASCYSLARPLHLADVASVHVASLAPGEQIDASELAWWAVQEIPELRATLT